MCVGATLCAGLLAASAAPAPPKVGARISVTACPYTGVTASCLMIKSGEGTIYNITGVTPRPRASGRMIWLRGTVTDKVSMCNEGIVLDRIRWTRTRQKCPN
jgi:hypothetical protein